MRKWLLLLFDLSVVSISPFVSILIRDNFLLIWDKLFNALPYTAVCVGVSCIVFIAAGVHRGVWKYVSLPDFVLILKVVTVSIGMTVCIVSLSGLYKGIALSVPVIQWAVVIALMSFIRVSVRYFCNSTNEPPDDAEKENIIIIGLSDAAGLYLNWARKVTKDKINVVGILDEVLPLKGHHIQGCQVIGAPVELQQILTKYKIHGITIGRVVVAVPFNELSKESQSILAYYETEGALRFDHLENQFSGSSGNTNGPSQNPAALNEEKDTGLKLHMSFTSSRRWYPVAKRLGDILLGTAMIICLSPFIFLIGILVLIDQGYPITFWQQRLGKGGRPFRLYKFRTMSEGVDDQGNRIPDEQRVSSLGYFLRRARLDELPQLYNIFVGEMSFVGPRPLLVSDQPSNYKTRLLIRPGLTGWAQVNGGKAISGEDKIILDMWYLRNISLLLDLKIICLTFWMVIFGERLNRSAIRRARMDLGVFGETGKTVKVCSVSPDVMLSHASKQRVA